MNALRHGLAASLGDHSGVSETGLDLEGLTERMSRIEAERGKITFEIETQSWEGTAKGLDGLVRQLGALERYAKRSASALRKK